GEDNRVVAKRIEGADREQGRGEAGEIGEGGGERGITPLPGRVTGEAEVVEPVEPGPGQDEGVLGRGGRARGQAEVVGAAIEVRAGEVPEGGISRVTQGQEGRCGKVGAR